MKKLEEEEKRASMLLKTDERKRPYNSMTESKVRPRPVGIVELSGQHIMMLLQRSGFESRHPAKCF